MNIDSMRIKVQDKASETFSKLTTETDFEKLEINESYGLKLRKRWSWSCQKGSWTNSSFKFDGCT